VFLVFTGGDRMLRLVRAWTNPGTAPAQQYTDTVISSIYSTEVPHATVPGTVQYRVEYPTGTGITVERERERGAGAIVLR
jgi:hypothetical protein